MLLIFTTRSRKSSIYDLEEPWVNECAVFAIKCGIWGKDVLIWARCCIMPPPPIPGSGCLGLHIAINVTCSSEREERPQGKQSSSTHKHANIIEPSRLHVLDLVYFIHVSLLLRTASITLCHWWDPLWSEDLWKNDTTLHTNVWCVIFN